MFIQHVSDLASTHSYSLYSIDEDGPIPSSDLQQVVIPRNSRQFVALQYTVDPPAHSNNYGIELYEQTKSFVTHIHRHRHTQ